MPETFRDAPRNHPSLPRSPYIDHYQHGPCDILIFSWADDLRQRLTFLYGDPDARMAVNAADLAAWHSLGRRAAA